MEWDSWCVWLQKRDVLSDVYKRQPQQITKIGSQRWAERAGISEEDRVAKYPSMEEAMPEIYRQLDELQTKLENHYHDMQDMEFLSLIHIFVKGITFVKT